MLHSRTTYLAAVGLSIAALAAVSLLAPGGNGISGPRQARAADQPAAGNDELAALRAEVERLKASLTMANSMRDIDYHSQALWFAGRTGNWPLAEYYLGSLQGHMHLVADKSAQGKPVDVVAKADQQIAENSPTAGIQRAIQRKDVVQFQAAYRAMLQSCYNCHKAVGKPYLRPRMPVKPAQAIINSDPTATWPE